MSSFPRCARASALILHGLLETIPINGEVCITDYIFYEISGQSVSIVKLESFFSGVLPRPERCAMEVLTRNVLHDARPAQLVEVFFELLETYVDSSTETQFLLRRECGLRGQPFPKGPDTRSP